MNSLENLILAYLENNPASSSKDVFDGLNVTKGYATVKRCLTQLMEILTGALIMLRNSLASFSKEVSLFKASFLLIVVILLIVYFFECLSIVFFQLLFNSCYIIV